MKLSDINALIGEARMGSHRDMAKLFRANRTPIFVAATAAAAAVTCDSLEGLITTEALTTAQNVFYTLTLTNSEIAAGDMVQVQVGNGTNSAGTPMLGAVTPAAGSAVINVINKHATAVAFNGTLKIWFRVIKATPELAP